MGYGNGVVKRFGCCTPCGLETLLRGNTNGFFVGGENQEVKRKTAAVPDVASGHEVSVTDMLCGTGIYRRLVPC